MVITKAQIRRIEGLLKEKTEEETKKIITLTFFSPDGMRKEFSIDYNDYIKEINKALDKVYGVKSFNDEVVKETNPDYANY